MNDVYLCVVAMAFAATLGLIALTAVRYYDR